MRFALQANLHIAWLLHICASGPMVFDMTILRNILFSAVLAALCVGVFNSVADYFGTGPLILKAEVYEQAGEAVSHESDQAKMAGNDEAAPAQAVEHHHDEGGWEPANGFERTAFTAFANILTAFGYAMILTGIFSLRGKPVSWREGLLFGLAGFVSVLLAPSLGLPPELPGTPAAALADRQIWWAATAGCTAAGLALIAFVPRGWAAVLAIVLFVMPHLHGAPLPPEGSHALAPEVLQHRFVVVATITSLIFWAALGALSALFYRHFAKEEA